MYLVDNKRLVYSDEAKFLRRFLVGRKCLAANPDAPIQQNCFGIVSLTGQYYYLFRRKLINSYFEKDSIGVRLSSHEMYSIGVINQENNQLVG